MSKLIEVQAAKEFADTFLPDIFLKMAVHRVLDAVEGVELVHCKECEHWDTEHCSDDQGWCPKVVGYRSGKWFCAAGERRKNEQDHL